MIAVQVIYGIFYQVSVFLGSGVSYLLLGQRGFLGGRHALLSVHVFPWLGYLLRFFRSYFLGYLLSSLYQAYALRLQLVVQALL